MKSAREVGDSHVQRENRVGKRNTRIKAAIYVRISLDKTGEALGVERQEAECRKLTELRGYEVAEVIAENSVSATKGERPGYDHLLDLIERRQVDVVVVYKLDRLLRKLTELEDLIQLIERTGIQFVTVHGDLDLTSSSGRLVARLLASVARGEVEMMSERRILANAQRAAQGRPYGTGRTYGYEPDGVTIREAEALVLKEMARKLVSGHSYTDIALWANKEGIPTAKGYEWRSITVRNRLLNKRYAGIRSYKGTEYPGTWEPIFDEPTWELLQLTISRRGANVPYIRRPRSYLLTGLLVCGKCGNTMIGAQATDSKNAKKRRTYVCWEGKKHLNRSADALDHFVRQAVLFRLDSPALGQLVATEGPQDAVLRDLLSDRERQKLRLDGLVDDYATGILNAAQLTRAKTTAEEALKHLEREIERVSRERSGLSVLPVGETVRAAWERETLNWRRALLKLLIKRVVVNPGMSMPWYDVDGERRRFDPSLIQIEWLV